MTAPIPLVYVDKGMAQRVVDPLAFEVCVAEALLALGKARAEVRAALASPPDIVRVKPEGGDVSSLYARSIEDILAAEQAQREGRFCEAQALYLRAAELQRAMVAALPAERVRTRSVYSRSAAALEEKAQMAHWLNVRSWELEDEMSAAIHEHIKPPPLTLDELGALGWFAPEAS